MGFIQALKRQFNNIHMKAKLVIRSLVVGLLVCAGVSQAVASDQKDSQAKLEAKAKISKADAQKTALAKVPEGKVKDAELEEEKGKLIWSFDIATPGSKDITEIQVDAVTGEVVSVEKETPADQKKEKQEKKAEKKAKKAKKEKAQ